MQDAIRQDAIQQQDPPKEETEPAAPGPGGAGPGDGRVPNVGQDSGGDGEWSDDAELALPYWLTSTEEAANTTFLRMLRRLPRLLRSAWSLAWQASRRTTIAVVALQLSAGVASAVGLISVVGVFDGLLRDGPTPERVRAAVPSLLLLVGSAVVRSVLTSAGAAANGRLSPKVSQAAQMRLLDLTTRVDLSTFDDPGWRDAMERARDRGIDAAQQLVDRAIELGTNLIGLAAAAGVLAVLHPVLLPLLVLAVLPIGWAAVRSARLRYRRMLRLIAVWRRQRMLAELLAAREPAPELRAFTVREYLLAEVRRLLAVSTNEEIRITTRQVRTNLAGTALSSVATGLTYVTLLWLLWTGRMELAVGGAAAYAISMGIGKLTELAHSANRVFEQGLYFADFQGFCDLSLTRTESTSGAAVPALSRDIRLDGVTFSYPDAERPAVRDVSMTLRRGEIVALVGENGSGKSTLAGLLAGLFQPQSGSITWDGVDLTRYDPETVRGQVAVVMQEPTRWPLSARANITIGRYDHSVEPERVLGAARAGDAHDFVMELARQYDTLLSRHFTDGADLSGGQWQRLAVSRAFYRDAPLLICDEPTANLDARAEHDVYQRLRELAAGRTVVLITHRMASVREADRIFVLDHGAVVEEGDHETLMAAEGIYAQLFSLQASAYQSAS
ncbi:ABC transporter ATP-binding protein [Actinoplanes auranticolor]|uniref:Multidrug ABC transporter permease n=1 Tax=Actinoplanes auranticolor TaxID=47988 RepID=A0A919VLS5_9ACTN|nr:ATP-binding cassette domain-containing protein [Actinoplanes auranticolor]GIM70914.1 multidrug ABC transporter permease [Actinoplanes auranticolor]